MCSITVRWWWLTGLWSQVSGLEVKGFFCLFAFLISTPILRARVTPFLSLHQAVVILIRQDGLKFFSLVLWDQRLLCSLIFSSPQYILGQFSNPVLLNIIGQDLNRGDYIKCHVFLFSDQCCTHFQELFFGRSCFLGSINVWKTN